MGVLTGELLDAFLTTRSRVVRVSCAPHRTVFFR